MAARAEGVAAGGGAGSSLAASRAEGVEAVGGEASSLASSREADVGAAAELPSRVEYHLPLTPAEVIELFDHDPSVGVFPISSMPDWADPRARDLRFTAELDGSRFQLHCGPPAARGQSGTGLLPLLYLAGALESTGQGTRVALRFAYSRPRWASQRRIGFFSLLVCASFWVFLGGGVLTHRVLFFLAFLLITAPVVVHDLRRGRRNTREKQELLALAERILGPLALDDERRQPYRRRVGP